MTRETGFTLVEISIVMIIIGLLIGGTFGGMKLVENMELNRTVQDLKTFDAAGITFRDIYGRLPGDLRTATTRLPNCTTGPCAVNGNGDRMIGGYHYQVNAGPRTANDEEFVFWQHLLAAGLVDGVRPTTDMNFGEGQPAAPISGGYRINGFVAGGFWFNNIMGKHTLLISDRMNDPAQNGDTVPCWAGQGLDRKMDDNKPMTGRVYVWGYCVQGPVTVNSDWAPPGTGLDVGAIIYTMAY